MRLPAKPWQFVLGLAVLALGCQPEIGDACQLSADCSSEGDRICDPTVPGGYCTQFNCEPGTCPEEAKCVAYGTVTSTRPECADPHGSSRLVRTYCMRSCSASSDCRTSEGYACTDLGKPNPWGAEVVEKGSHGNRVCLLALSEKAKELPPASTEVCGPVTDASFPDAPTVRPVDAGTDASPVDASADGGRDR